MQRICLYYALPLLLAQRGKREKKKRVVGVVLLIVGEELLEPIFLLLLLCYFHCPGCVLPLGSLWEFYLFLFVYFVGSAEVNGNGFRI